MSLCLWTECELRSGLPGRHDFPRVGPSINIRKREIHAEGGENHVDDHEVRPVIPSVPSAPSPISDLIDASETLYRLSVEEYERIGEFLDDPSRRTD